MIIVFEPRGFRTAFFDVLDDVDASEFPGESG